MFACEVLYARTFEQFRIPNCHREKDDSEKIKNVSNK